MPLVHVAGEGLMVAEAGDDLGVGEHLGEGLEDKAGRGEVVFSESSIGDFHKYDFKEQLTKCPSLPGLEPHVVGGIVSSDHDVVKIMLHPDVLQHLESIAT